VNVVAFFNTFLLIINIIDRLATSSTVQRALNNVHNERISMVVID
jgi:hypothetical protein